MCGLAGFYPSQSSTHEASSYLMQAMVDKLNHRGPDDLGIWIDANQIIALGHRRLSILDISSAGHQPMSSANGRFVLTYNGEIYNHLELRTEIEKDKHSIEWIGNSDTETLLSAFETWGIEKTLPKLRGMFAIALWDTKLKKLSLVRDRFGEKPLYYGWIKSGEKTFFSFASELKALSCIPEFKNSVSKQALKEYFKYMYVPCPLSIYDHIFKLEPGCILQIDGDAPCNPPISSLHSSSKQMVHYDSLSLYRWYDLKTVVEEESEPFQDELEATNAIESELKNVINLQSISDVPLGAFLSGGVDSSTIVSLMQQENNQPVKTFTIGFEDPNYDESKFASEVANHLRTDHSELIVTANDALSIIPSLPDLYDEPFADSSQIPTYFVCKSAKQDVTVALSGDAGDELFGGYNRHITAPLLWNKINWLPFVARKALGSSFLKIPPSIWDSTNYMASKFMNSPFNQLGDKVHKTSIRLKNVQSIDDLYLSLIVEPEVELLVKHDVEESNLFINDQLPDINMSDPSSRMMYRDMLTYLTDDILCKVDRAAMSVSLETRVPFLDHKIVELAWKTPIEMKIKGTTGKSLLRNILYKSVPKKLIERPKTGFSIPLADWLRGPLRDWADALLEPTRIESEGYLQKDYIQRIWNEHLTLKRNWTNKLWSILMFQSWLENSKK
ncbi:asparagine synthase (glutamine-hydrolyzing) [Gammaproteobacteria bacterium]|nr:asparagine synthase (glutamine-hydrolyzing) [Gammaproteobacteria bacterium]